MSMLKFIYVLVCSCSWVVVFGQETVAEFSLRLQSRRAVAAVIDSVNSGMTLFMVDRNSIAGYELNKDFSLKNSKEWAATSGTAFGDLVGAYRSGDMYCVVTFKNNADSYSFTTISFDRPQFAITEFNVPKDEEPLVSYDSEGKWFVATIKKKKSVLHVYEFLVQSPTPRKHTFDFSEIKFGNEWPQLYYSLMLPNEKGLSVSLQRYNMPKSLRQTYHRAKFYFGKSKLYLTIDRPMRTRLLEMDLTTDTFVKRDFKITCDRGIINSFLLGESKLIQSGFCVDSLTLRIHDVPAERLIKDFTAPAGTEVNFRNTPFIEEGGRYYAQESERYDFVKREPVKTRRFYKKLQEGHMAVSAYYLSDKKSVRIALGSVRITPEEILIPSSDPAQRAWLTKIAGPYDWSSTAYFETIVDGESWEHLVGEMHDNNTAIDRLKKFAEEKYRDTTIEIPVGDYLLYGYYDKSSDRFILLRFK
jgi:hypothetical protein